MKRPTLAIRRRLRSLVFAAATVTIFVLPAGYAFARGGHGGGHSGGAHFGGGHVGVGGGHVGNARVAHYGGAHFDGHVDSHIGGRNFGSGQVATGHFGNGGIAAHHNSSSHALSHSTSAGRGSHHFTAQGAQQGSSLAVHNHGSANHAGAAHSFNHAHHDGFHHHHHHNFFFYPFAFGYPYFYGYGYPYRYPYNYGPAVCDPNSPYYDPDDCDSLYSQDYYQGYDPGKNPVPATQPTRQNRYPVNKQVEPEKNSLSSAGTTQMALQTLLTNGESTEGGDDAELEIVPARDAAGIYVPLLPTTSAPEVLPASGK